jgi:hypothetical protein
MGKHINYIKEHAVKAGQIEGFDYYIVPAPFEGTLNGYVVFPNKPVRESGYDGIVSYVPVHGGITYCHHEKEGSIYGFDTLHCDSADYPRTNESWIEEQITIMLHGIQLAAKVELKYLKAVTNKGKGKWAQMVQDLQPEQSKNFGVMIKLLSGQL